ncbi:hypothetical protein [Methanobacterium sp.]|uniref:hypothetical protein n=1 Tax=Methanobacterium sp. TaxID=2164 RepID=UPI003D6535AB
MTTEQFNKYYTGNALTMNPDGRGTPLSTAEMENLFGAVYTGLFNPYDPCSYAAIKSMEATQKAIQTGNPWDYFNYTFLTIPGYKNWDGWGVGNIKALLDFGLGIDENGDMSMGNTLINLVSLIPIARVASWGGKALKGAGILEKLGLNINLGDNWLIRKIGDFTGDLGKKLKLDNPENLKNLVSGVSNVIFPNPVGWFTSTLEFGAKLTKNENLISAAKYLNDFQLKRGIGDLGGFISDPIGKLKDAYFKTGKLLNDNITYTAQLASAAISNAKTAVVKTAAAIKTVVNKTITQVKTAVNKVVTKVKTAISNAVKTVKTVANNVINTVNNTVNWIKGKVWPW